MHDLRDEVHRMERESGGRDYGGGGYRGHGDPAAGVVHGRSRSRSRERRGPYPAGGGDVYRGGGGGRYSQPPPAVAGRYADGPAPYYDSRGAARHSDDRDRGDSRYPPAGPGGRGPSRPSPQQWDERETGRGPSSRGGGSGNSDSSSAGVTVFPNPHYPPKHAHHTLNSLKRGESVGSD